MLLILWIWDDCMEAREFVECLKEGILHSSDVALFRQRLKADILAIRRSLEHKDSTTREAADRRKQ